MYFVSVELWVILVMYLTIPTIPIIQQSMNGDNSTKSREFLFEVDYKIDHEKYFYLITAHTYHASMITVIMILALDTLYIIVVHHCCVLFEVTGYANIAMPLIVKDT